MNAEVDIKILKEQIEPNAASLAGEKFIMQQDNDHKHNVQAPTNLMRSKI